ncbi:MAG: tRNA lysidine(34) synthetase TilS, partial [Myxococcota bacterium]
GIPALMATADQPQPIYRTLQSLRDDRALVERLSADALSALRVARPWYRAQGILVARRRLRAFDRLMQRHVIRAAFRAAGLRHMPDRSSILRVLEHLDHTGAIIEVHGAHVEIEPKRIAFVHRSTTPDLWPVPQAPVNLDQPGDRILWGTRVTVTARRVDGASEQDKAQWLERCRTLERGGPEGPQVAVADASEVAWPLTIRPPHPGERLHRLGGGHKTLAALMSDARVPRLARPWIPVIHGRCGNVL